MSVPQAVQGWAEVQRKTSQKCETDLAQEPAVPEGPAKQLQQAVAQHGAAEGCWKAGILCCKYALQACSAAQNDHHPATLCSFSAAEHACRCDVAVVMS